MNKTELSHGKRMKSILAVCALLALLTACSPFESTTACEIENATRKAQADREAKSLEAQTALQKRIEDLQIEVLRQCVAQGNIPLFLGGNVDCKTGPSKPVAGGAHGPAQR